jgi:surface protein
MSASLNLFYSNEIQRNMGQFIKEKNEYIDKYLEVTTKKEFRNNMMKRHIKKLNINILSLKQIINLLLIIYMILLAKTQGETSSGSSFVILRFSNVGLNQFIGSNFNILPDELYIDDILQDENTRTSKMVNITNKTEIVKLVWNSPLSSCKNMFNGLTYVYEIDMSGFDSSSVTDSSYMFCNCPSLYTLNLSGFSTRKVINMDGMFQGTRILYHLDLSHFDTSSVVSMANFFYACAANPLDVSSFNTTLVYNMERMFQEVSVEILNLSNFKTPNLATMRNMFSFSRNLQILILTSFDTSHVNNFIYTFESCSSLKSLDVSNFDTSSAQNMIGMFLNMVSLETLDISHFKTENVKNMEDFFKGCEK